MNIIALELDGQTYRADAASGIDISIPLNFDMPQLQAFGAPAAHAQALSAGSFIGDVKLGGSCNCNTYSLTPHCNGTHTECVAHITSDKLAIGAIAPTALLVAELISVLPAVMPSMFAAHDRVITCGLLQATLQSNPARNTVIVRTLPNNSSKLTLNYDASPCPAYFTEEALAWLASIGIEHLLVDLPSVDRMEDGGLLSAHRAFWGMPPAATRVSQAARAQATITEFIYVPDVLADGHYLLNLQVAPFVADAAPSRPVLYPLLSP